VVPSVAWVGDFNKEVVMSVYPLDEIVCHKQGGGGGGATVAGRARRPGLLSRIGQAIRTGAARLVGR